MVSGVVHAYKDAAFEEEVDLNYCDREEFITDHDHLVALMNNGNVKRCASHCCLTVMERNR